MLNYISHNQKKNNNNQSQKNHSQFQNNNSINDLLYNFDSESLDSVNSNYFTEQEQKIIKYENNKELYNHFIFTIFGFLLIFIFNFNNIYCLLFEIILSIIIPYIFIPLKLLLNKNKIFEYYNFFKSIIYLY